MAHSRSALKRWRQSIERRDRNRSVKSRTRTLLTKALIAIEDDANASEETVRAAISGLDRAAQKGVIHANAAARSKSRLLKRYNLAVAGAVAAAAGSAPVAEEKPAKGRAAAKPAAEKKTPAGRTARTTKAADKPASKPSSRTRKS